MILTGKALEYAEGLQELDNKLREEGNLEILELDEPAQADLYHINHVYCRDKSFQHFIRGCSLLYAEKAVQGKDEIIKMVLHMEELI